MNHSHYVLFLSTTILLSSCGGGSGSTGAVPEQPTLNLNFEAIKEFSFSWLDVEGETAYKLLENSDGISGFSEVATLEENSTRFSHTVSLYDKVNASYILEACNSNGCSKSDEISISNNMASSIGYFKASNTGAADKFGSAVSLSADGTTLAVSAPFEDSDSSGINSIQDNNGISSGAVYVFKLDTSNNWLQQAYLKASNTGDRDDFGFAISLSDDGNSLAVGAPDEDSNMSGVGATSIIPTIFSQYHNNVDDSGAVYIFNRDNNGNWAQHEYIKASHPDKRDNFGIALQISGDGNTLVVGAHEEDGFFTGVNNNPDNNDLSNSGAAYVFLKDDSNQWTQKAYIKAFNAGRSHKFGREVSISVNGNILAISAQGEDSNAIGIDGDRFNTNASSSGAVYTYQYINNEWKDGEYIKASNTQSFDNFGRKLNLSGDGKTLAVVSVDDSNASGLNDDANDNAQESAGSVFIFKFNDQGNWFQQAYIKAFNTSNTTFFGNSISLSNDGNLLAVGSSREKSNSLGINGDQINELAIDSGAVYTYKRTNGLWAQQAYIKASNTEAADSFGHSVSLASDSKTLAVGATFESSRSPGIGNRQDDNDSTSSGAVYLY